MSPTRPQLIEIRTRTRRLSEAIKGFASVRIAIQVQVYGDTHWK
jgi:hypothetical protein